MRTCKKCGVEKPLDQFRISCGYRRNTCKDCLHQYDQGWNLRNPGRQVENNRQRIARDPEKRRRIVKNCDLRRSYGISLAQYEEMLDKQNGVCAICRMACKSGLSLAVDHVHGTTPPKVRGLLCANCNRALGLLGDSPYLCDRAAGYLRWASCG